MTMDAYESEEVFPCSICGRNFIQQSLFKHEIACQKLQKLHRKVFDSGKQRASGSDIPLSDIRKAQNEKNKNGGAFPRPKTHWRERHEEFISALSASRGVKEALKTGAPLPPPPPRAAVPNDFVKCEHCGRNFNQRAADRHISFCRDQHARKQAPTGRSSVTPAVAARSTSLSRTVSNLSKASHSTTSTVTGSSTTSSTRQKAPAGRTPSTPSRGKASAPRSRANSVSRDASASRPAVSLGGALVDTSAGHPPIRPTRKTVVAGAGTAKANSPASSTTTVKSRTSSQSRLKTPKHHTVRR